ncbi:unnamed protein product [Prorocentrum cordatum]|uniref:Uncharacterized protein n=1 Tax=Prorocentrum cordatum TaxID=2364126 RepID=A0ABN9VJF0_9DINO|nr:unnamed protein product [Polarella glacialis]
MAAMAPIGEESPVSPSWRSRGWRRSRTSSVAASPRRGAALRRAAPRRGRDSWSFPDVGIPAPWGGAEQGGPQRGGSWGFPDVGLSSLLGQGPECPEGPREAGGAAGKDRARRTGFLVGRPRPGGPRWARRRPAQVAPQARGCEGPHGRHLPEGDGRAALAGLADLAGFQYLDGLWRHLPVPEEDLHGFCCEPAELRLRRGPADRHVHAVEARGQAGQEAQRWWKSGRLAAYGGGGAADPQPAAALARKPPQIATLQPWKPLDKAAAAPPQPMAVPQIATTSGGGGGGGGAADPQPAAVPARKPAQIATLQQWRPAAKAVAAPPQPMAVPQIATTSGGGGGGGGAADPQPAAVPARKPAQIATLQPWRPAAKAEEQGLGDDEVHSSAMQVPSEPLVRIPEAAAQPAPGAPEPPECTSSEPPVCSTMSYPTLDDSMMLHAGLLNPGAAAASPRRASLDTCLEDPAAEDPAPAPAPAHAAARPAGPDGDSQRPACLLGAGLVGHVVTTGTDLDLTSLDQQMPGGQPLHR